MKLGINKFLTILLVSVAAINASDALDYAILSVHARAEALGKAAVAQNLGPGATFINPVSVINDNEFEVVSSTGKMFEDYVKFSFGLSHALSDGNTYVGVSYAGAEIDGLKRVEKYDERPEVLYEASDSRSVLIFTAAKKAGSRFAYGLNLKHYRHAMFEYSATGLGLDVGFQYRLFRDLTLGAAARNINGGELRWSTGHSDKLEQSMQVGLAYKLQLFLWEMVFSCDNNYLPNDDVIKSFGAEIWLVPEVLALRGGKEGDLLNLGVGLKIQSATIDYVYSDHEDLSESHKLSVGARF